MKDLIESVKSRVKNLHSFSKNLGAADIPDSYVNRMFCYTLVSLWRAAWVAYPETMGRQHAEMMGALVKPGYGLCPRWKCEESVVDGDDLCATHRKEQDEFEAQAPDESVTEEDIVREHEKRGKKPQ